MPYIRGLTVTPVVVHLFVFIHWCLEVLFCMVHWRWSGYCTHMNTLRPRQNVCLLADGNFICIILNKTFLISNDKIYFIEICSLWSNWQYVIIGSDNGLAPNRRQAIIWTSDGLVYWCIYVLLGLNELNTLDQCLLFQLGDKCIGNTCPYLVWIVRLNSRFVCLNKC